MDILQQMIDAFAAQLLAIHTAAGVIRAKIAKAYEALTDHPIAPVEGDPITPEEVTELKKELADLRTRVGQIQQ